MTDHDTGGPGQRAFDRYESLAETVDDAVFVVDEAWELEYANASAVDVADATREELLGTAITTLTRQMLPREDAYRFERALADTFEAKGEPPETLVLEVETATERRFVEYVLSPMDQDGDVTSVAIVAREVTERRRSKQRLRARQQELERQNERLAEFASIVSHDLRNPLNVAQGRLELARMDCDSEHLDTVTRAHDRIEALVDDLLTLARGGESVEDADDVDLAALARDCWTTVDTADASYVVETDRTVRADRGRLRQLIENLIRNAVEHGGTDVTVTVGDLDDGFYVADDGPGVPADRREQVFEEGFSTTTGGTGYGLAIVEQVVEAHGWEVRLTDGEDGGARFEVGFGRK